MTTLHRATPISLKDSSELNERWLQGVLKADPSLLGLGDLTVRDVERRQPGAGRLDLLLADPEGATRYEVEIQLGATDESHIIRAIEYWDLERRRYPQYEHVAVLVAEDVTSRTRRVYPRASGGTSELIGAARSCQGLSPRERGNRRPEILGAMG